MRTRSRSCSLREYQLASYDASSCPLDETERNLSRPSVKTERRAQGCLFFTIWGTRPDRGRDATPGVTNEGTGGRLPEGQGFPPLGGGPPPPPPPPWGGPRPPPRHFPAAR